MLYLHVVFNALHFARLGLILSLVLFLRCYVIIPDETLLDNVYNENHAQKRVRDNFVAENYGPAKLPRLEKIVYKVSAFFIKMFATLLLAYFPIISLT